MAKKPFAWDTEVDLGVIKESEKAEHHIKRCTLNGKEFIVAVKMVLKNDEWIFAKNQTFEIGVFGAMAKLVRESVENG